MRASNIAGFTRGEIVFASPGHRSVTHPAFESIKKFRAAVIRREVQQLLGTAVILRNVAVVEFDAAAVSASDQRNIKKETGMRNQSLFVNKMTALATALLLLFVSSATRVEAAAVRDLTPEQTEVVIEEVFAGLAAFDVQRVVNHFAPDAVVEDPVGTPPIQGREALAAYLGTFPVLFSELKLYSLDVKVRGQEAAVKWRLRFKTKTGNVFFLDGIGIFKFNEEGKITSEREFFDLEYFLAQLQK